MNKLRTFRETHKITQTELAKVLNTSQKQISMYENGIRELKESQIAAICREFHVSADFLLGLQDQ
jgi:transcriptional regulator with XRE-family HTH domain